MLHPVFESNDGFKRLSFDRKSLYLWADEMFEWLFCIAPVYINHEIFCSKETELRQRLVLFVEQTNSFIGNPEGSVSVFFDKIPEIHDRLISDLDAVYHSDPAAKSIDEVLFGYPGFYAVAIQRIAHELWRLEIPVIPRLMTEYAHFRTGIDIHPAASIGERFMIDHGTGVVIGETCIIGDDVKMYQGVTLGALSVNRESASVKRHPTIGNRVVIYANATILGSNTTIGDDTIIGGNVWITRSIPPNSLVFHKSEIVVKSNASFPEPLNYII